MAVKRTSGTTRGRMQSGGVSVRQPTARRSRQESDARGVPFETGEMEKDAEGGRGMMAQARDRAHEVGGRTRDAARGIASGARGVANRTGKTAAQVARKVSDNRWPALLIGAGATWLAIDAARGRGGDTVEGRRRSSMPRERNSASDAVRSIAGKGRDIGGRVGTFVRNNPVLAGATTLGVGLAVGMALPQTAAERAVLGDARQKMVRKAKDAARDGVRNVRDVAEGVQKLTRRG